MTIEIDHIFLFIEPEGPEIDALSRLGFLETYRRAHPGQGTANVCFAFDNLYLELLWLTSEAEARSPAIARTRLWERSQWRRLGTCPFGIAFRGDLASAGVPTWGYRPPYLPPGMSITVATDSDDPMQPMLFVSPGREAPRDWPAERQGRLQRDAGWGEARVLTLKLAAGVTPSAALVSLAAASGLTLQPGEGPTHGLSLDLVGVDGSAASTLAIPAGLG
jgi:Glyoxalase-like domain